MSKRFMHRRTFLRGALGGGASVAVGLPLLEAMLNGNGTALAQNEPLPRRLGVFFWGNGRGVEADKWRPATTGAGWQPSPLLAPLMPLRDSISVVTGMTAHMPNSPRGHHDGSVAILSGHDFIPQDPGNAPYRSTFSKPSIDQLAADQIGTTTPFRSLEVGISTRIIGGEGTTLQYLSHNGPDNPNPPEVDARALFTRLFSDADASANAQLDQAIGELRQSVLDGVVGELGTLRQRVGTADRARLDQHAEHIRAIERRLSDDALRAPQCAGLEPPAEIPSMGGGREPLAERTQAMAEVLALALSCDLSRVFTLQFTGSVGYTLFWQVGADRGHHDLSHEGAAAQSVIEATTVFTMEQLATLLTVFRDTPDGAGNLLDSSAILASSDHSDGAAHSLDDFPVLVAGGAGGALRTPGVHYAADRQHTNRVLLTVLRAVGVDIAEIGDDSAHTTDGCSEIET